MPIMLTVEEKSNVDAFANYELPADLAGSSAPSTAANEDPAPAPVAPAAPAAPVSTTPPVIAASAPAHAPVMAAPASTPIISAYSVLKVNSMKPRFQSPLADKISADQQAYIDRFGRTGHKPLVANA